MTVTPSPSTPKPPARLVQKATILAGLRPFDEGGEGIVFGCDRLGLGAAGTGSVVYKEYKPSRRGDVDADALDALVRFPDQLPAADAAWLRGRAAWPSQIVVDSDGATGVLMDRAPVAFSVLRRRHDGAKEAILAKFELLLNGDAFLRRMGLPLTNLDRFELLFAVAETVAFLHQRGVIVGDFSCRNILFSLDGSRGCYLIDCDSMALENRAVLATGETPEWEVPDGEPPATSASDVYKFALLALRLFSGEQHHRDPGRLPRYLPTQFRVHVRRSLAVDPDSRPSMASWLGVLARASRMASRVPTRAHRPSTVRSSPVVWHCREDYSLNGGESCCRCGRRWDDVALEVLGPLPAVAGRRPWFPRRSVPIPARPGARAGAAQPGAGRGAVHPGAWPGAVHPSPQPAAARSWRSTSRDALAPTGRQMGTPSGRHLATMVVALWAACVITFAVIYLLQSITGGPVHALANRFRTLLPVIYLIYGALAVYYTVTERSPQP